MWSRFFWIDAFERAVKTAAEVAILFFSAGQLNVFTVEWKTVIGLALGGAVLSVLASLASSKVGFPSSPSLVD